MNKSDSTSAANVFRRRDLLVKDLCSSRFRLDKNGKDLSLEAIVGDSVRSAVPVIAPVFAQRLGVSTTVVEQSLFNFFTHKNGAAPLLKDFKLAAWALSANRNRLKEGIPLNIELSLVEPEWTTLIVLDVFSDVSERNSKDGATFKFVCVGGSMATKTFNKFFSRSFFFRLESDLFGISKKQRRGLASIHFYAGLQCCVLLFDKKGLNFEYFRLSSAIVKWNRDILRRRAEVSCPKGLSVGCDCCPVGLDRCGRATHEETFDVRKCPKCFSTGFFKQNDPAESACLYCREKTRLEAKRRKHET